MRNENAPISHGWLETPSAPYDPPQPAPQAAAWRRALKVVGCAPPHRQVPQRQEAARAPVRTVKPVRPVKWA